jgi:hypothetical protein
MTPRSFAHRLCLRWVRWYTHGLPRDAAERRRAEVASDLWEHERDASEAGLSDLAISVEVVGRVLSGMPADLSWRRALGRQPRTRLVNGGKHMSKHAERLEGIFLVLVAFNIALAAAMLPVTGSDVLYGIRALAVVALLVAGLALRTRAPMSSLGLVVIGAAGMVSLWFWLPPLYLLGFATIVVGVITTRRPRRREPAPSA